MKYIGSLEAAEKHISAKIFKENLHTFVKILQICGSSRFSAAIFAEPCRKNLASRAPKENKMQPVVIVTKHILKTKIGNWKNKQVFSLFFRRETHCQTKKDQ